eukprot:Cvel_2801.t1-p1 / transcript=Cvel_2801.t1 / gene=Cvel_2801 / organism=Chromera_velia_CCMP2878 / gene_product=hypothetical protein / transcript_product=hypothetical protein / location=Cvel_scaffold113:20007-21287(-) / protein_length=427 / sequence_SO=supercontig / SO=protein_coding / is_pseudo=false
MILKGSQRGGARQLAAHLMNDRDNDHITLHELRGFVASDLRGALDEANAISKGTKCRQFMFSLSLNPPKDRDCRLDGLVEAADRAEDRLGLKGQPRAVIVHEKEGRRHIHVVWSRIDANEMKAINLPHFKTRLAALSKELYLDHGWELPDGHKTNGWKNPLNFTLAEWQQAKRIGLDPREIKQVFQEAWARSDNAASFKNALEEYGYYLAKGDRRGFVAVDVHGEVFSVARQTGVRTKAVREKLGEPDKLPSVDATRDSIKRNLSQNLRGYMRETREHQAAEIKPLQDRRKAMVTAQRLERKELARKQAKRLDAETKARAERLKTGLLGVWELLTGKAAAIRKQNDAEAYRGYVRDRGQREDLFEAQIKDRQALQLELDAVRKAQRAERARLVQRMADVISHMKQMEAEARAPSRSRGQHRDFGLEM